MKNTHVLVTGANRGIGLEMTRQFLTAGAKVTATARNLASAQELKQLAGDFPTLRLYEADITIPKHVETLMTKLNSETIDILINNAGAYLDGDADFAELNLDIVSKSFDINTIGAMRVTQALLPCLERATAPKVINISSLMGSIEDNTSGGTYAYRMSKAALNMFTKTFAVDFPKIATLTMHPGWVKTDMGGANAPTEKTESVKGLLKVILASSLKNTGQFIDFEGDKLPW